MWKSPVLGLLAPLHKGILLVFMWNYETISILSMMKMAFLYHISWQSHPKNSHDFYILKQVLVC